MRGQTFPGLELAYFLPVSCAAYPRGIIELKSNIIVGQLEAESKLVGVIDPLNKVNQMLIILLKLTLTAYTLHINMFFKKETPFNIIKIPFWIQGAIK